MCSSCVSPWEPHLNTSQALGISLWWQAPEFLWELFANLWHTEVLLWCSDFLEIQNSSGDGFSLECISTPGVRALERKKLNLVVNLSIAGEETPQSSSRKVCNLRDRTWEGREECHDSKRFVWTSQI